MRQTLHVEPRARHTRAILPARLPQARNDNAMTPLSSILVDIDALAANHPALERAVDLAARCGARVKVVDVLAWVPSNARHFVTTGVEEELVEHRHIRLTGIAEAVT